MISPKLAILMATMAVIGAGAIPMAPMALAQQNADVDIERNNESVQNLRQFQQACRGEARAVIDDEDVIDIESNNRVEVEQGPDVPRPCIVAQGQEATNAAAIVDASENSLDVNVCEILVGIGELPSDQCLPD